VESLFARIAPSANRKGFATDNLNIRGICFE
jgi:hypothetical protein